MRKCKKCIWGTWATETKVVCMFPNCFIDKLKDDKNAKKTTQTM